MLMPPHQIAGPAGSARCVSARGGARAPGRTCVLLELLLGSKAPRRHLVSSQWLTGPGGCVHAGPAPAMQHAAGRPIVRAAAL